MKKTKRMIALLLSLVMVLPLSIATAAEGIEAPRGEGGSEDINSSSTTISETDGTPYASQEEVTTVQTPVGVPEESTENPQPAQTPTEEDSEPVEEPSEEDSADPAAVQSLIDALPDAEQITEENAEAVAEQLSAIDTAKAALTDEQLDGLNTEKYIAAAQALGAIYDAQTLGVASYNGTSYDTITDAITAAGNNEATIEVTASTTENVVIPAGANITLNIPAGVTVSGGTDKDANGQSHTITNNGTLTITGEGTLENTNAGSGVVFNTVGATANLNGCIFVGNIWYVLKNLGTMNIRGASVVQQDSGSSAIANGWYDSTNGHPTNDCGVSRPKSKTAKLKIYSGTFSGGMNTVKNDDYGTLYIYDGNFTNTDGPVVLNWHSATIEGGSFTVNDTASSVIANGYLNESSDMGALTIKGGSFTASNGGTGALFGYPEDTQKDGSFRITGGTFTGSVAMNDFYPFKLVVTGGIFTDENVDQYAKEGNTAIPIDGGYTIGADRSENSLAVAEVNGLGYISVQDALANSSGAKVTLLKDADTGDKGLGTGSNAPTLDLDGHTLYLTGTNSDGVGLTVRCNITIENGTICDERSFDNPNTSGFFAILVQGNKTLSLNNMEVISYCPSSGVNTILFAQASYKKSGQINISADTVIRDASRENGGQCQGVSIEGGEKAPARLNVNGGTIDTKGCCIIGNGTKHNTEITIEDGSKVISSESLGIYHPQQGTLNVKGGTISGVTGIEMRAGTLNVTGGTITGTGNKLQVNPNSNGSTTVGAGIAVAQHGTKLETVVNISGGKISGAVALNEANPQGNDTDDLAKVKINIENGSFTATDPSKQAVESEDKEHFVSGGSFSTKVPLKYCAENLVPTERQNDNSFTVTLDPALVAEVTQTVSGAETVSYYPTLQDAINAVTARKATIRLLVDQKEDVELNLATKPNITLDLNGNTLDGSITNTLSILEIRDYSEAQSGRITGNITNTDAQYSTKAATTRVYGGHIGGTLTKGNNTQLWAYEAFYKEDPSAFIDAGYLVKPVSDDHGCTYQIVEDQAAKILRDGQEIIYRTLSNALSDAKPGETVTLMKNFTGNSSFSINKSITVDLNGCTVTGTQPAQVFTVNGYPDTIDVTIKNGTIIHSPARAGVAKGAVYVRQNCNLILEDVEITANPDFDGNSYGVRIGDGTSTKNPTVVIQGADTTISAPTAGIAVIGSDTPASLATLTVKDGTIKGGYYGIAGNGDKDNTSITVSGGSISGDIAIYHPQDGSLTIEGGDLTGKQGIQYLGAGTLTISGGSITATDDATGEPTIPTVDGSIDDGAAVSIISRGGEYGAAGTAQVSITGGRITSDHNVAIREYGAPGLDSLVAAMNITQGSGEKLLVTGGDDVKTAVKLGILSGDAAKVISGGSFSSAVPDEYCAADFQPTKQRSDGTYSVENQVNGHAYDESTWQFDETNHFHLCTICEEEKSEDAAHTYKWVEEKAPTCTEKGSKHEECEVCGYKKASVEIPVIAHTPGSDWKFDKDNHWHECSCGSKSDIAAHEAKLVNAKEATATEKGYTGDTVCKVCGYTIETGKDIPAIGTPVIVEGQNGKWTQGSKDGLAFKSSAAFADFQKVLVDGTEVDKANYTVSEDSTIVTLKPEYLATLSVGTHTLSINFTTGTASTEFEIKAATAEAPSNPGNTTQTTPKTGDNSHMFLWIAILFVSGSALIGTTAYGKKKKYSAD